MRNINSGKLNKETVLNKISQISIFATYFNLKDDVIKYCINTGELICSPIREDIHPSFGFRYDNRNKLKARDFAGYFWGDCFDAVALVMSSIYKKDYDVSNKSDFIKILRHITLTFKDVFYGEEKDDNLIKEINSAIISLKNRKPIIELVIRNWNEQDRLYWSQFGVSLHFLNLNYVHPVEQFYIDRKVNPQPKYFYKNEDPCYGYVLGKDRNGIYNIKLYFPNRTKGNTRFITNCNHLEGIYNLNRDDYDIIVITKSTKDRVSLGSVLNAISVPSTGKLPLIIDSSIKIGVINIPHETYRLRQNEYDWLREKLKHNGKIISLMDNDRTGKLEAIWLRNSYDILPILIPKYHNSKDFAEFVNNNLSCKNIVVDAINTVIKYIQTYERKNNKPTRNTTEWSDSLPF